MSHVTTQELLDCALSAAHDSGDYARHGQERRTEVIETFRHDVKLQLDVECQRRAESVIRARFPEHAILGEEDDRVDDTRSEYQWIVDPIDGTVNFSHGLPNWCCAIAVRKADIVLAAAVYVPEYGDMYTATIDSPSLCNGEPIGVSDVSTVAGSAILTGIDKNVEPDVPPLAFFERIALRAQRARIYGCAGMDLCLVARGAAEGYFETGVYTWDTCAGGLIVRAAGGAAEVIGEPEGHRLCFLASNGHIHDELKAIVGYD
jgi:myo-inositol-1(or 4)-monophosphatase